MESLSRGSISLPQEEILRRAERLQSAAAFGYISQCPQDWFTADVVFARRGFFEETVIHAAARTGTLSEIPVEFVTEHSLTRENTLGQTALHLAAEAFRFGAVPSQFRRLELLDAVRDAAGLTALQVLSLQYRLHQIPVESCAVFYPRIRSVFEAVPEMEEQGHSRRALLKGDRTRDVKWLQEVIGAWIRLEARRPKDPPRAA
ncbi:hypothetical protein DB347_20855 [Opitutaceae bacterium EW11]|nr:hypothetical protein DB347_20855 [Opitutaceae bacterium EW11]